MRPGQATQARTGAAVGREDAMAHSGVTTWARSV
jgi:hypothetical protein